MICNYDTQAFADDGPCPDARGGRANVIGMIPASQSATLLTREQAEAAGWFAAQEVLP